MLAACNAGSLNLWVFGDCFFDKQEEGAVLQEQMQLKLSGFLETAQGEKIERQLAVVK